jgi:hypothetical protein
MYLIASFSCRVRMGLFFSVLAESSWLVRHAADKFRLNNKNNITDIYFMCDVISDVNVIISVGIIVVPPA